MLIQRLFHLLWNTLHRVKEKIEERVKARPVWGSSFKQLGDDNREERRPIGLAVELPLLME